MAADGRTSAPTVSEAGAWVRRAADGDQHAWNQLVEHYTSMLWAIARGFRLPAAEAADAVQTTWLRLVENLDRIEDPDRVAGWLATTVRRECLRLLRASGRERPHPAGHPTLDGADTSQPLDRLIVAERDAALWESFQRLSDRCRCLLRILMAQPRPSYGTVAAALRMPVGSIGPTRARCLARLRSILADGEATHD